MGGTRATALERRVAALEHYARGELRLARAAALDALSETRDDVECLRLAGRAGVELGAQDAVEQLRRVAELEPGDAEAWRDLGDALAADGRLAEAREAWSAGLALRPDDGGLLTALGHTALAAGQAEEAAAWLQRATEVEPRNRSATHSLVDALRRVRQLDDGLAVARRNWEEDPHDVLAGLDVAELSLAVGAADDARTAWERLRAIDDETHEVYALYGLLSVALLREDWRTGAQLAAEAARLDASQATARILAFFASRQFGSLDRAATTPDVGSALAASQSGVFALPVLPAPEEVPDAAEVRRLLEAARGEHRSIHNEERALHDDRSQ